MKMKSTTLLLLSTMLCRGAVISVCATGCSTTSLQTALDSLAACGDTIQIKSTETQTGTFTISYRGCTALTPITVTSDRASWLPPVGARITPSHLANMAQVVTNTGVGPALADHLDGMNRPPAHWIFVGVAFSTSAFGFDIVGFNAAGTAANASQISDDITFDRCYFYMPSVYATTAASNALRGNITNLVVKNSFFGDSFRDGQESHGISVLTDAGPITVTNNFITTMSIPVFVGGADPSYAPGGYLNNGGTVNYNYFWRPWKYNPDPSNPHFSDYTTAQTSAGGYLPCNKNLGELKWGIGVAWQYNVGENAWFNGQCMEQFVGFTDTLRTNYDTSFGSPSIGAFTMANTTHISWSGTYQIGNPGTGAGSSFVEDLGVCIQVTAGVECHPIASFSGNTLVTSVPFSSAPAGSRSGAFVYAASAQLTNVTISHNAWKNADQTMSILGISPSNGVGNAGFGKNHTISQNLWYSDISYIGPHAKGVSMTAGEQDYSFNALGYTFDHNTFYYPAGMPTGSFVYMNGSGGGIPQPAFDTTSITNNLFGVSSSGGNGPFSGDGVADTIGAANTYFVNSNIKNNAIPGGMQSGGVNGGNLVSGNIYTSWSDPFAGLATKRIFKLAPATTYSGVGTDRRDLGVDFDLLPQISGLKVTAGVTAALLEFDLTAPIGDAAGTQPCTLEVSSSRNLHSDLGTYTVVNDLNPAFFRQPDTSARTNAALPAVVVNGRHVYWPVGQNATVVGDDGVGHSLALAAGTTFYGRLMCYGDSRWFIFQTGSGMSNSVQYPLAATLQVGTTAGTTGVRLQYGATPALGGTANFIPNSGATASFALPLTNGSPTYYKLQFLNGATVTYTSPIAVYLGGD
jgi:hypothetical protein